MPLFKGEVCLHDTLPLNPHYINYINMQLGNIIVINYKYYIINDNNNK